MHRSSPTRKDLSFLAAESFSMQTAFMDWLKWITVSLSSTPRPTVLTTTVPLSEQLRLRYTIQIRKLKGAKSLVTCKKVKFINQWARSPGNCMSTSINWYRIYRPIMSLDWLHEFASKTENMHVTVVRSEDDWVKLNSGSCDFIAVQYCR